VARNEREPVVGMAIALGMAIAVAIAIAVAMTRGSELSKPPQRRMHP
jgi:hypothetical protein